MEAIKYLESLGGNISSTSKTGASLLHSAAERDEINSFLYLYDKLDLNSVDHQQNTPLHFACFSGSENVVEFLLAQ